MESIRVFFFRGSIGIFRSTCVAWFLDVVFFHNPFALGINRHILRWWASGVSNHRNETHRSFRFQKLPFSFSVIGCLGLGKVSWYSRCYSIPSLKLTAKAPEPENGWLEYVRFLSAWAYFQGWWLLVSGSVLLCKKIYIFPGLPPPLK